MSERRAAWLALLMLVIFVVDAIGTLWVANTLGDVRKAPPVAWCSAAPATAGR